ncbi:MAG: hypothetical protein HKM05_05245 [Spirochaetales bacterium]|nr:hypothetical protein [Spirochaetales bacterium]
MSRKVLLFCLVTAPLFLFIVVAQSVNFQSVEKRIQTRERLQSTLVERNQQLLTGISVLSSPERIGNLAQDHLGLKQLKSEQSLKLRFDGGTP